MDGQLLFDKLLLVSKKLGVEVRVEPFETRAMWGGGLCVVRGEKLVLIDRSTPPPDCVLALALVLSELESDAVYMAPEVREVIEAIPGSHGSRSRAGLIESMTDR
jgi:hypothetical protein